MAGAPGATPLYPTPGGQARPLRVVLVCPPRAPAWVGTFARMASENPWLALSVLVDDASVLPSIPRVPAGLRAFVAMEHAIHGRDASLVPEPVAGAATGIAASPESLAGRGLDLVLRVGSATPGLGFEHGARLGCWQLDPGLLDPRHAGLPLLEPMLRGDEATQVALVLAHAGRTETLASSWGRTRAPSFALQRRDAFLKLPALLLRALHRLAREPASVAAAPAATLRLAQAAGPVVDVAGLDALRATLRAGGRSIVRRHVKRRDWMLAVRREGEPLDPAAPVLGSHQIVRAPRGWWADPCVVEDGGRTLVFVEEMVEPGGDRAVISCAELGRAGATRLGVVLEEDGHLSYPQAFRWSGRWYMTVESNYARRVSLYRAEDFPMRWSRMTDLVSDRVCVDPTLHHHEGRWYLFANVAECGNSRCDDLFLFVADRLEGPYAPHPVAPVVGDVRRARMAGRLFLHKGRLIRPAQDCAPSYGSAVVFNEVLELGPATYRERALARFAPLDARRAKGFHTYSRAGGVEVIDALGCLPSVRDAGSGTRQWLDGAAMAPRIEPSPRRAATRGGLPPG